MAHVTRWRTWPRTCRKKLYDLVIVVVDALVLCFFKETEDEIAEREHYSDVLLSFVKYRETTSYITERWKLSLRNLRPEDAALLPVEERIRQYDFCTEANGQICDLISQATCPPASFAGILTRFGVSIAGMCGLRQRDRCSGGLTPCFPKLSCDLATDPHRGTPPVTQSPKPESEGAGRGQGLPPAAFAHQCVTPFCLHLSRRLGRP